MEPVPKAPHSVKPSQRLTRRLKAHGKTRLQALRDAIYDNADALEAALVPKYMYLPDPIIDTLLDRFALLKDGRTLDNILANSKYTLPHVNWIRTFITTLDTEFKTLRAKDKKEKARQKAEKQAAAAAAEVESEGEGTDEVEEDEENEIESQDEEDYNVSFGTGVGSKDTRPGTPRCAMSSVALSLLLRLPEVRLPRRHRRRHSTWIP